MSANKVLDALRDMSHEDRAKVRALLETISDEVRSPEQQARHRLCEQDSYRKSDHLE